MLQCRVNQRARSVPANHFHATEPGKRFAPVDDIIDHCDLVSRKFAREMQQLNIDLTSMMQAA